MFPVVTVLLELGLHDTETAVCFKNSSPLHVRGYPVVSLALTNTQTHTHTNI